MTTPVRLGFDPARLDRIPAFLSEKYVGAGRLPHAATMVLRHGEVAHLSCVGDARAGQPLRDDALFRIASMTKPLTSVVGMQLVEEGRIALSDPVAKHLPEFANTGVFVAGGGKVPFFARPPATPMRVIDLFRHTSGLTYGFQERTPVDAAYRAAGLDDFDLDMDLDGMVAALAAVPLQFDPGTQWNYGVSTDVLGALIQRVLGQPFGVALRERLLDPLGMVDTGFLVRPEQVDRLTDAYVFDPRTRMALWDAGADSRWSRPRRLESGGGGLVSTLADYGRFCGMLLGRGKLGDTRILSRKTFDLMTANHLPGGGDLTQHSTALFSESENAGVGFGLGMAVTETPHATMIPASAGDMYWGGMFTTGFFADPAEDMAMIFMTQLMPSSTYPVRREVKTLVHAALDD